MIIKIINYLNAFARENTFFSIIILGVIANIITELFKKIFYLFVTTSSRQIGKWNIKNIKFLINHYTEELKLVENINQNKNNEILNLVKTLYNNILLLFLIVIIYFVVQKISNDIILFYSSLAICARLMFNLLANTYYNLRLFQKSTSLEQYKLKIQARISKLEKVL